MIASTSRRALLALAGAALTASTLPAPAASAATAGAVASVTARPSARPSARPIVTVHGGAVRGIAVSGGYAFRGLPYAAPPTGELRWMPPQPVTRWQEPRDATSYANTCPQVTTLGVFAGPASITEESADRS